MRRPRRGDDWALVASLNLGGLLTLFADPVGSRPMLERARELTIASGEERWLVPTTTMLASSYLHQDDHERAGPLLRELRPLAERFGYDEAVAWYWTGVGWTGYVAGDHAGCREACVRAIVAARKLGDPASEAGAMAFLALCDVDQGEPGSALSGLPPVRARALAHGGAFTLPWVEVAIGLAQAAAGRLEDARSTFEELLERGAGGIANALTWAHVGLAESLRLLAEGDEAEAFASRGLELAGRIRNHLREAQARLVLGRLAATRGEWAEAQRLGHEALSAIVDCGYRLELPRALEALAEVAAGLESLEEAARILGAAKRARSELGLVAWKHQREEVESLEARVREALGVEAFEEGFAEGEALAPDEAVAYVRRARGSRKRPSGGWESLTPTELEVARHAAAGLTNPEIAERMFISRSTVKVHLRHIYAKLEIRNRSELAAAAAQRAPAR